MSETYRKRIGSLRRTLQPHEVTTRCICKDATNQVKCLYIYIYIYIFVIETYRYLYSVLSAFFCCCWLWQMGYIYRTVQWARRSVQEVAGRRESCVPLASGRSVLRLSNYRLSVCRCETVVSTAWLARRETFSRGSRPPNVRVDVAAGN